MLERRSAPRIPLVFSVSIESARFGELVCVGRNISAGGMFVETTDPLPIGEKVTVHFEMPDCEDEIVAHGEVKHHYYFCYGDGAGGSKTLSGMGINFDSFADGARPLPAGIARLRVAH
jgi:hypothetical protein